MRKFKFLKKEEIERLPKNPGVYAFRKGVEFLYIGKAANIRERARNHFSQPAYRDSFFLDKVEKIGYIKTDCEIEALVLEANLIKKYQPKYNIVWRDNKNYFFVGVSKEDFPRVFWTHQIKKSEIRNSKFEINYVGPFVDGKSLKQALKVLRKAFPYRSCKTLPNRSCLWYHLNRCLAPCLLKSKLIKGIPRDLIKVKKISQRNARNLIKILKEGKGSVLRELKKEMGRASKKQEFEEAARIRDQINALERIISHARIFEDLTVQQNSFGYYEENERNLRKFLKAKRKISRIEAYDVSNIQGQAATGSMITFIKGKPAKNFYRRFKIKISGKPNDVAMLRELLSRRFRHSEWELPDLILIDGGRAQLNAAKNCLKQIDIRLYNSIHLMALAKKRNELFIKGQTKPIRLDPLPNSLKFAILQLRDEAHRFALSYHKKLRAKDLIF